MRSDRKRRSLRLHSAHEDRTIARDKRERTRSPSSSRTSRKASGKATPRVARKQTSPHVLTSKEAHAICEEAVVFGILQTVFLTRKLFPRQQNVSLRRIAATFCSEMQQPRSLKDWTFPEESGDASANFLCLEGPFAWCDVYSNEIIFTSAWQFFSKKSSAFAAQTSGVLADAMKSLLWVSSCVEAIRTEIRTRWRSKCRATLFWNLCRSASILHAMLCDSASFARSLLSPAPCQKSGRSNFHQLEPQQTHGTQEVCSSSQ